MQQYIEPFLSLLLLVSCAIPKPNTNILC